MSEYSMKEIICSLTHPRLLKLGVSLKYEDDSIVLSHPDLPNDIKYSIVYAAEETVLRIFTENVLLFAMSEVLWCSLVYCWARRYEVTPEYELEYRVVSFMCEMLQRFLHMREYQALSAVDVDCRPTKTNAPYLF